MKKYKPLFKICSLFALLIFCAFLPILITNINSDKLLNKTFTEPFSEEFTLKKLSTAEKIKTVVTASTEKKGAVTSKDFVFSPQHETEILKRIVNQLNVLTQMKAIPDMNYYGNYKAKYGSKLTFMNLNNSKDVVDLLQINLQYSDYEVYVMMEAETSLLYEVSIYNNKSFKYDGSLNPEKYMDYLGLSRTNISIKREANDNFIYLSYSDETSYFRYKFAGLKSYYSFSLDYLK